VEDLIIQYQQPTRSRQASFFVTEVPTRSQSIRCWMCYLTWEGGPMEPWSTDDSQTFKFRSFSRSGLAVLGQLRLTITVFPPADIFEYNPATGEEELVEGKVDLALFPKKYQLKNKSDLEFSPQVGANEFNIERSNRRMKVEFRRATSSPFGRPLFNF